MKRLLSTSVRCTATNSLGLQCGHIAVEGTERCQFHKLPQVTEPRQETPDPPFSLEDTVDPPFEVKSAKEFAKAVLESLEFRNYIVESLRKRTLSASIILRLMDYAEDWGRPPDRVEHTGKDGEALITEVRRVIVHPESSDAPKPPPTIVADQDTLEMHAEDLDVPMIPVPPRRMH